MNSLVAFYLVVALLAGASTAAQAQHTEPLHVERWGHDGNPCSQKKPCQTINRAIELADGAREILVGPGLYEENLVIRDDGWLSRAGLQVKSKAGRFATMIKAANPKYPIVRIQSASVRFGGVGAGFTVLGNREDEEYLLLDYLTSGQEGIVVDNPSASAIIVEGNRALGLQLGYRFYSGPDLLVANNIAKKNKMGFYCLQCTTAEFRDNQAIENHQFGMQIGQDERADWSSDGIIARGGEGWPDSVSQSRDVSLAKNKISFNYYWGLRVSRNAADYSVTDNVFDRTTTDEGVELFASGEAVFLRNIISGDRPLSVDDALDIHAEPGTEGALLVAENLMVGLGAAISSDVEGQAEVKIERNRAVDNTGAGFRFTQSPLVPEMVRSNASHGTTSGCGIYNARSGGEVLEIEDHFFGPGDTSCGSVTHVDALRDSPVPLNVDQAKAL